MDALPLSKGAHLLLQRMRWLAKGYAVGGKHHVGNSKLWPDLSDAGLEGSLGEWLSPWLAGVRTMGDLKALDWTAILR